MNVLWVYDMFVSLFLSTITTTCFFNCLINFGGSVSSNYVLQIITALILQSFFKAKMLQTPEFTSESASNTNFAIWEAFIQIALSKLRVNRRGETSALMCTEMKRQQTKR